MAFALRPEDYYHTGIVVPDLEAAMAGLSALAGEDKAPLGKHDGRRRKPPAPRVMSDLRRVGETFVAQMLEAGPV